MHILLLFLILFFGCGSYDESADSFSVSPNNEVQILNGEAGDHSQFPSIVFLARNGLVTCSGTLIKPDLVLTAAHCTFLLSSSHKIVYGHNSMPDVECDSCFHNISDYKYHDDFHHTDLNDDISVILLETPITNAVTANLITEQYLPMIQEDQILTIAGYGRDNDDNLRTLIYGDVPITEVLSDQEMILGKDDPDATNACYGDSGGPSYLIEDGAQWLSGVTSRVPDGVPVECGHGAIYVRPNAYIDWIESSYVELLEARDYLPETPELPKNPDHSEDCCDPEQNFTTTEDLGCQMNSSLNYKLWIFIPTLLIIRRSLIYTKA